MSTSLLCLWFSCDRAWQLSQALDSFTQCADCSGVHVEHVVVYNYTNQAHADAYERVFSVRAVRSVQDSDAGSFIFTVRRAVDSARCDFVVLAVDDAVFINEVSIKDAIDALRNDDRILNVALALHTRISYCHSASTALTEIPEFTSTLHAPLLQTFARCGRRSEFNYPFTLAGGVYRHNDIRDVIYDCGEDIRQPNDLEIEMNNASAVALIDRFRIVAPFLDEAIRSEYKRATRTAALCQRRPLTVAMSRPTLIVITVNRVQNDYRTPIYTQTNNDDQRTDTEALRLFVETSPPTQFDFEQYRQRAMMTQNAFNSVHVGLFLLNRPHNTKQNVRTNKAQSNND